MDKWTRSVKHGLDAAWALIPEHMHESIAAYILEGRRPGHFLRAVLENNLAEAVGRADGDNRDALAGWVLFLVNYAPGGCWRTPERVVEWIDHEGLKGLAATRGGS